MEDCLLQEWIETPFAEPQKNTALGAVVPFILSFLFDLFLHVHLLHSSVLIAAALLVVWEVEFF